MMQLLRKICLILICLTASSSSATGAIYGPERGKCYRPENSREIGPDADLRKEIKQLSTGKALVLSPGSYFIEGDIAVPEGTSIIAKRIDDHCSNSITVETTGMIVLSNTTELNGLNIKRETPCRKDCNASSIIRIGRNVKGIRILNNRLMGTSGDKVQIASNAEDITIRGNDFIGGDRWMIGVRGNPTKDVLIEKNRFRNCGDDCIQAENHINLYIIGNEFYGGENTVQLLDIKVAKGDSLISHNTIECRNIRSSDCVLYHASDYEFPKHAKAEFSNNKLIGCTSRSLVLGGNKTYKYRNLIVRNNTFDSLGNQCEIRLNKCINCYIDNNDIIGGRLRVNREIEQGIIQSNRFLNTKLTNHGGDIRCIGNVKKNSSGRMCDREDWTTVSVPEVLIQRPQSSQNRDD